MESFLKQPPGFEDLKHPDHVYKLKKSLYGLKQAPRRQVDTTLFKKTLEKDILIVQIYVDDIILVQLIDLFARNFLR